MINALNRWLLYIASVALLVAALPIPEPYWLYYDILIIFVAVVMVLSLLNYLRLFKPIFTIAIPTFVVCFAIWNPFLGDFWAETLTKPIWVVLDIVSASLLLYINHKYFRKS